MLLLTAFVVLVFAYSLMSRRLERTVLTAPILFTVAGISMAHFPGAQDQFALDRPQFLIVAELGLVMLLFTDASRSRLGLLKDHPRLPARLLAAGMPLTIALGSALAFMVLGDVAWPEACILAAILAPTDAGLGQALLASPQVPQRIRQALAVEAGLNDGLAVPFMMFFIALAVSPGETSTGAVLGSFLVEQLGLGVSIGLAIGLAGGWLLGRARRAGWIADPYMQLGVVALPLGCVIASEAARASMFIAAFVAGLAAQAGFRDIGRHSVEFAEDWGQLLSLFIFFLFGIFVAREWTHFGSSVVLYAILSLTVVRMVPVAIALRGLGLARPTVLFVGWFGPRGLASIVLGLVFLEGEATLPGESTIRATVAATVLFSIFAHGLTAAPGTRRYAKAVAALDEQAPERHAAAGDGDRSARG